MGEDRPYECAESLWKLTGRQWRCTCQQGRGRGNAITASQTNGWSGLKIRCGAHSALARIAAVEVMRATPLRDKRPSIEQIL